MTKIQNSKPFYDLEFEIYKLDIPRSFFKCIASCLQSGPYVMVFQD